MDLIELHERRRLNHDILPADEQREFARRWLEEGDRAAREQLLDGYELMIFQIAYKYRNNGVPIMDLIQEGRLGFLKGLDNYDPERARLSTYVQPWIYNAIQRACIDQKPGIRRPIWFAELYKKVSRVAATLEQELERSPTPAEIGTELGEPADRVAEVLRIGPDSDIASLEADAYRLDSPSTVYNAAPTLESILPAGGRRPDETTHEAEKIDLIYGAVRAVVSRREAYVLALRYGLGGEREHTLQEAGDKLGGISRERVRQLQARAEAKLSESLYAPLLREYLEEIA